MQQDPHISIAVDAMGGDFAPAVVVEGALDALRETRGRFSILLVGRRDAIEQELRKHSTVGFPPAALSVTHASEVIDMQDSPNAALKTKRDSSIGVGLALHRDGKAQAFVSAGNTGAVLSASTLILGRIPGVGRPTIGALVPTARGRCLLVDAGTNVDCKPRHLLEFGVMGSIYVSAMLGIPEPSVGLLNIGEEEAKGNEVALETYALMKRSRLHFTGNIEGRDILKGTTDVVVCDGFVGNILLKFGESVPAFFKARFSAFARESLSGKLIGLLARRGLRSVMKELDYQEHGGVPLLGVNGVSIIGHGGSTPKAIKNMIFRAEEMVLRKVNQGIQEALKSTLALPGAQTDQ
jgi:glycerol-3-phosphate acyltransferase PlsX